MKKTPVKLFVLAFAAIAALTIYQNMSRQKVMTLLVKDNKGVSFLETSGKSLVCVFQDGKTCVWDWNNLSLPRSEFQAASERAVVLGPEQLAAITAAGKKILTVYSLPDGQIQKELTVGWEDQEVWPRISFDKKAAVLIRKNPPDSLGNTLYEFLTINLEKDILGLPVSLSVNEKTESLVDYAADSSHTLFAGGSRNKKGRIAALNLETGGVVWNQVYENTQEFCSLVVSPDNRFLLAGNRDGVLYKINAADGTIDQKIILLKPGETRPVTNDYSVLNLAFSPDGQYYIATINPPAYLLKADSDELVKALSPADKLVSKIAFSPDNSSIATSDIRASYPVKIWPMREIEN